MKRNNFSIPVIALLAGAALGYCFAPQAKKEPAAPAAPAAPKPAQTVVQHAPDETLKALRGRIRELEQLLMAEREAHTSSNAAARIATEEHRPPRMPPSPREMMEHLRTEDPERFAQMTNRMARFRRDRIARAQSKIDFLSSVDTSTMSKEAVKVHEDLQNMIEQREEIEAKMHNPDLSDAEREAVFKEMHEADNVIRRLNAQERSNLLAQTAEALGFSGEDAEEIVATVGEIISATEMGRHGPPPPPHIPNSGK